MEQHYTFSDMEQFVTKATGEVHRRYRHYVDYEDLAQEIRLWLYGKGEKKVRAWLKASPQRTTRIYRSMTDTAKGYAEIEKAAKAGYDPEDVAWYSPATVEGLLPLALDETFTPQGVKENEGGRRSSTPASERGTFLAMVLDVRRALDGTGSWGYFSEHSAGESQWDDKVSELVDYLGGRRPQVGRRSVMSNSQAQAITRYQESA